MIWEREGVFPLNIHLFIYPFSFVLFIYTLITIIVGCCSLRLDKNYFLNMYKGYIWSNRSGFFYQTGEQIFFVSNPSPFKTMFYESIKKDFAELTLNYNHSMENIRIKSNQDAFFSLSLYQPMFCWFIFFSVTIPLMMNAIFRGSTSYIKIFEIAMMLLKN